MSHETLTISTEVPKEWHELMMGIANIALKLYDPLSDGVDLEDIDDIANCIPDLWEGLKGVSEAFDSVKHDPSGVTVSSVLVAQMLYDGIVKIREQKGEE